jgi:hypothetical protein
LNNAVPNIPPSLETMLEASKKELAEAAAQRDLALRLLRRQTLINARLQKRAMIPWFLNIYYLPLNARQSLIDIAKRFLPARLKILIKRHLRYIRS